MKPMRIGVPLKLAVLLVFLALASAARAQGVFYIDPVGGSNAQDGTEKTHTTGTTGPWKSHPYMQTASACTGGNTSWPGWTHHAGDQYIFKGGTTFSSTCFGMQIAAGGTSSVQDYYGVDVSWYSGSSFTQPKFDLAGTVPAGSFNSVIYNGSTNYITYDDFEIANEQFNSNGFGNGPAVQAYGATGIIVNRFYIHGFFTNHQISNSWVPDYSVGGILSGNEGLTLENSVIDGSASYGYNTSGTQVTGGNIGGGCETCGVVSNTKFIETSSACFNVAVCHDNDISGVNQNIWYGCASNTYCVSNLNAQHTQAIEDENATGGFTVYNNAVHDNPDPGINIFVGYKGSQVYNNVLWNNSGANKNIQMVSTGSDTSASRGYLYHNTVFCDGTAGIGIDQYTGSSIAGQIFIENTLVGNCGSSAIVIGVTGTVNQDHNDTTMTTGEASMYGLTSSSKYAPGSSDPNIVGMGLDQTGTCSAFPGLCQDTEGAFWYGASYVTYTTTPTIGAYQWPLSGTGNPVDSPSPSSLTFSTQTTGTSSSAQTVTLTNSGSATDAISNISPTGTNASQFTDTTDCGTTLTAGSSCHIFVTFSPTIGGSLVASISITDTVNPSGAAIVSLSGTGQAPGLFSLAQPPAPDAEFTSSPTCTVTFGSAPANGSSVMVSAVPGSRTGDTLTAVDANGKTYTLTPNSPSTAFTGSGQVYAFHLDSASGAAAVVTITDTTATPSYFDCGGVNFQVVAGYTPSFDADAGGMSASGTPLALPSFTPSTSQEALFMMGTPENYFSAVGAPWTSVSIFQPNAGAPHWGTATGYIVNQTGAVNPNLTSTGTGGGSAMIEAFKATATGSTPTITSLSITSGNEGASVTIGGANFGSTQSSSTAQINSTAMTCGTWGSTSLICIIPTPATTGGISVTTSAGTSNSETFTVTPNITSLSVGSGYIGDSITAHGSGFGAAQGSSTLSVGVVTATVTAWSDSAVTFTIPAGAAPGNQNVNIIQGGNASNSEVLTVLPKILTVTPSHAVVGAGVLIGGGPFGASPGASTLKFDGTTATCTSWANTSLSCPVPAGAMTGNIVAHVGGNDSNGFVFTVDSPVTTPVISSVTPSAGPAGTVLTINGANFGASQSTSTLTFNGISAAITSWSATQIVCIAPTISLSGASTLNGNILVTVSGNASNPTQFTMYLYSFVVIGTAK